MEYPLPWRRNELRQRHRQRCSGWWPWHLSESLHRRCIRHHRHLYGVSSRRLLPRKHRCRCDRATYAKPGCWKTGDADCGAGQAIFLRWQRSEHPEDHLRRWRCRLARGGNRHFLRLLLVSAGRAPASWVAWQRRCKAAGCLSDSACCLWLGLTMPQLWVSSHEHK